MLTLELAERQQGSVALRSGKKADPFVFSTDMVQER
jgi:hypothetical protein